MICGSVAGGVRWRSAASTFGLCEYSTCTLLRPNHSLRVWRFLVHGHGSCVRTSVTTSSRLHSGHGSSMKRAIIWPWLSPLSQFDMMNVQFPLSPNSQLITISINKARPTSVADILDQRVTSSHDLSLQRLSDFGEAALISWGCCCFENNVDNQSKYTLEGLNEALHCLQRLHLALIPLLVMKGWIIIRWPCLRLKRRT